MPLRKTTCGVNGRCLIAVISAFPISRSSTSSRHIKPDFVHVLAEGRIVESGGPELALELEQHGYAWVKDRIAP